MLTNKEISQNFEVQINTLYNWRKSKPKLYKYLKNADYNFEQSKEINILLERFAKDISSSFTTDEILLFLNSKIEARSMDDVENIDRLLLISHQKEISIDNALLFGTYNKLNSLGIIEKYIFYKRAHNLKENKEINKTLVEEYFSEFLGVE